MAEVDRDRLTEFLAECVGRPVSVTSIARINVGHSRAMYRVATDAGGFVLRVEQGGVFGTSGAAEVRVMRALAAVGFPVATVRWLETTGSVLGAPFFVMDLLDVPRAAPGVDERALDMPAATAFVECLARLHALDVDPLAAAFGGAPPAPDAATHLQIERWAAVYRCSVDQPIPLLEEAAAWLHHHAPPLARLSVVHGDPGPGNVLIDIDRVVAMTDWEFAHLGDPAEDWSFCLTMRGRRTMPAASWLTLFDERAGVRLTAAQWRYWEAFNLFKGACANTTALALFEGGANRSPNMAIIGTHLHRSFLRRLVDITAETDLGGGSE